LNHIDGAGATGLIYLFSVYSSALKKRFKLSQTSLGTIETCMFLAGTLSGKAWHFVDTFPNHNITHRRSGVIFFLSKLAKYPNLFPAHVIFLVFSGVLVDRLGPANGMRLGGGVMAFCFLAQFLVCERRLGFPDAAVLPALCALCAVQFLCSSCITASVFSTLKTVYAPHESSGWVVGVGKGWVGLFGAIVTQLYSYTAGAPDDSAQTFEFLLFLAGAALLLTVLPSFVVTKHPLLPLPPLPPLPYYGRLQAMTATVVLTCATTATGAFLGTPSGAARYVFLTLLLALFCVPLLSTAAAFDTPAEVAPYAALRRRGSTEGSGRGGTRRDRDRSASLDKDASLVGAGPLASPLLGGENGDAEEEPDGGPRPGRAHSSSGAGCSAGGARGATTWVMVHDGRCWLLLWCTFCVIGSGVLVTTNAAQMVEAVGAADGAAAVAVTLFSVAQVAETSHKVRKGNAFLYAWIIFIF
jgi:hypothetical protein